MHLSKGQTYEKLEDKESSDLTDGSSSEHSLLRDGQSGRLETWNIRDSVQVSRRRLVGFMIAGLVLATNICTMGICFLYFSSGNTLLRWTSGYSPIFDRLHIPAISKELHIPLFPNISDPRDIYRLPPSPEVDAAWDRISNIGLHSISETDVRRLGKDPMLAIHSPTEWWSEEWGSGWMVEIDAFHQIHCLNALRKGLITNYQYYWGDRYDLEPPVTFAMHLNHCMGALLENLMCHADVDTVTYNWRETQVSPFPDFAIRKQCRDFNAILEWQEKHKLKNGHDRWYAFEKPADAKQREVPPGLTELGEGTGRKNGQPVQRLDGLPPQCV
ncbi:hypothetical protein UA08_06936 [Talaromyces atroroseus]|uniref:Tat pathway signal sequence n=1 Tax=Talaromyces atroroseus TaxID=1441469 RepID=A0A225A9M4_TALAT|nr:hypothetical protein UA08_06936 [Talaromyces atroroseus]OKL57462.1 hypothetical protein UA08_06936 [Talaromyces atroroseus]